jgi:HAD superfamily hydrolase (TIGR01549 family)
VAIAFVYFDLDDTLVDTTGAVFDGYAAALAAIEPAVMAAGGKVPAEGIPDELAGTFGSTMPEEYLRAWLYETGVDGPRAEELAARGTEVYARRTEVIAPFAEARPVLEWLERRDIGRGIISDGRADEQREKLERAGLARFFGPVFVSENYPVFKGKPSLAMFEDALAAAEAPAAEVMYVGDRDKDVIGANLAGMVSVRVRQGWANRRPSSRTFAAARADYVIDDLGELPAIIEALESEGGS